MNSNLEKTLLVLGQIFQRITAKTLHGQECTMSNGICQDH